MHIVFSKVRGCWPLWVHRDDPPAMLVEARDAVVLHGDDDEASFVTYHRTRII